jgi:hypothetical protein
MAEQELDRPIRKMNTALTPPPVDGLRSTWPADRVSASGWPSRRETEGSLEPSAGDAGELLRPTFRMAGHPGRR